MPTAKPTMPASASGVSKQRFSPYAGKQPVGDPEDAAELPDVLAEDDHPLVVGHRVPQARR